MIRHDDLATDYPTVDPSGVLPGIEQLGGDRGRCKDFPAGGGADREKIERMFHPHLGQTMQMASVGQGHDLGILAQFQQIEARDSSEVRQARREAGDAGERRRDAARGGGMRREAAGCGGISDPALQLPQDADRL